MSSSARRTHVLWLGAATAISGSILIGAPACAGTTAAASDLAATGPTIEVIGRRPAPLDTETGLSTMATTVQDTPQAINLITSAQLKQQGVTSLEQALKNVPGITIAIGEGGTLNGDQFKIRGFDAANDVFVDGLRDFGVYIRDSFDSEEVQVLKGPSGALFGRGSVGGAINTLSKTAKLGTFGEVDGYAGGGDFYRGLADFNQQVGPTTALRLNLMGTSQGVVDRDHVFSKRTGAALSAGFGLGTRTSFTINFFHQDDRRRPDYGVTILQPPGSVVALPAPEYGLRRSTFLGFEWDADHTRADVITTRFKTEVNPNLTLTSDTRLGAYSRYFQYTTVDSCNATCNAAYFDGNPATVPNANFGGSSPYKQRDWGAQNITAARYAFDLGGLRNEAVFGWDLSYQQNKKTFYAYALPAGFATRNTIPYPLLTPTYYPPAGYQVFKPTRANLFCPAGATPNCTTNVTGTTVFANLASTGVVATSGDAPDYGLFFTDRLFFTPQISALVSLREDWYTANYASTTANFVTAPLKSDSALFDPRVNLIYEPSKTTTYYLTYGKSSTPQASAIVGSASPTTITAQSLQPEESTTYEAGAKVGVLKGRLSLTASVFDIKKNNATQTDPSTGFVQANSGQTQEVRGVELGVVGKITRNWTLTAGYTYLDARIKQDFSCTTTAPIVCKPNPYTIGRQVVFVPRNAATLWTTYDLHDWVQGLSVGGGATYQSLIYGGYTIAGTAPNPTGLARIAEIPESLNFDGYVAWQVGRYRLAVNGYNLGDRLNYSQVFGNRAVPAPGRTIIASIGVRF
jgi:catecholate siderophore receptor